MQDPETTVKEAALSVRNGHSLRTSDWAYMCYKDKMEELYDMNKDPGQFTNLARNPKYAQQLEKMRDALTTRLKDAGL